MGTKDQLELAARLARIYSKAPAFEIAVQARNLIAAGRAAKRLAEVNCNIGLEESAWEKWHNRILNKANRAHVTLAMAHRSRGGRLAKMIRVEVTGDPRGYCLRLFHPELGGNTWGGDSSGYGV